MRKLYTHKHYFYHGFSHCQQKYFLSINVFQLISIQFSHFSSLFLYLDFANKILIRQAKNLIKIFLSSSIYLILISTVKSKCRLFIYFFFLLMKLPYFSCSKRQMFCLSSRTVRFVFLTRHNVHVARWRTLTKGGFTSLRFSFLYLSLFPFLHTVHTFNISKYIYMYTYMYSLTSIKFIYKTKALRLIDMHYLLSLLASTDTNHLHNPKANFSSK